MNVKKIIQKNFEGMKYSVDESIKKSIQVSTKIIIPVVYYFKVNDAIHFFKNSNDCTQSLLQELEVCDLTYDRVLAGSISVPTHFYEKSPDKWVEM